MADYNEAPRHIVTPDDSGVDPALSAWVARVPRDGYGGASKSAVLWMPKSERLRAPYVRVQNTDYLSMIVVDADHGRSDPTYPLDVGLPPPNLAVGSYALQPAWPDSGGGPRLYNAADGRQWREREVAAARCHYVYLLKQPVTRPRAGRRAAARHWKPMWYYFQVAAGMNAALSGDWAFPGYLSKNPLRCDQWHVVAFRSEPYTLGDLAACVDLGVNGAAEWIAQPPVPGRTVPEIAQALHAQLGDHHGSDDGVFVVLREAAKRAFDNIVADTPSWAVAEVEFRRQVDEAAMSLRGLTGFEHDRVMAVARQVANHFLRNYSADRAGFTAQRDINRGALGLTGRPDLSLEQRQKKAGPHAARKRQKNTRTLVRKAEKRLRAGGYRPTAASVARESGVARQTARKHMTTETRPGRPRAA